MRARTQGTSGSISKWPALLLAPSMLMTGVICVWLGWHAYRTTLEDEQIQKEAVRFEELHGDIMRLAEVLTMSARMAAATGDRQWEERYRHFEPQLDAAIKEAMQFDTDHDLSLTVGKTDTANLKLVEMEHRSFELVRSGHAAEASTVLFSDEYEQQKREYADGMAAMTAHLKGHLQAWHRSHERNNRFLLEAALVGFALLSFVWVASIRRLRKWERGLVTAVDERTADLEAANTVLEMEIAERKGMEKRIRGINDLQAATLGAGSLDEKLKRITDGIVDLFSADFCRIWLTVQGDRCDSGCVHAEVREGPHVCRYRNRCLHLKTSSGRYTHIDGKVHRRVPFGCYKIGRVASGEDHKFLTNNVTNDPRVHNHDWARELGLVSFAGYQLRPPGEDVIGVLAIFSKHAISSEEDALMESLVNTSARVVQVSRAEEELRRSEEQFRCLFDNSRDALMMLDSTGFLECNKETLDIFGCTSKDQFVCKHPSELSPPTQPDGKDSFTSAQERIERAFKEGSQFFEWVHERMDGTPFPAEVFLYRIEFHGKTVLQAVVRNINDRKKAEQERNQMIAILEATPDFVGIADAKDGRILYLNKAARLMIGVGPDEDMSGMKFLDGHPQWSRELLSDETVPTALREGIWRGECAFLHRDGRELPVSMVFLAQKSHSGEVEVFSTISRDITESKKAEAELIEARDAAQAASRAKSGFLANMSHEIRTPMTAILGYTDLLTDPELSPDERQNYVAVIHRNGEQLLGLINDILDLSKIEAGKMAIDKQPCNVSSVVADVASIMRVRCTQYGILLSVEYANEIPETIQTDQSRLRQALINLVGNALKFTERGAVRIVITLLPDWRDGQPAVTLQVIDTGIGIAQETLAGLFEPFVQADVSTSRRFGGSGLGLAITRRIAELLGGEVTAESTPGKGSTFTLTVPTGSLEGVGMLNRPSECIRGNEVRPKPQPHWQGALAELRLLLAEDGPDNQLLIKTVLERAGASVEIAQNGRVAVEKIEAAGPSGFDVILMDMQMPEIDGYEATRALRTKGYAGPILALTAHAMSDDRDKCVAAGCDDYLNKPIDRGGLIETVARWAKRKHSGSVEATDSEDETRGHGNRAVVSEFADDPELASIIDQFVAGLAGKIASMREALDRGCDEELQRLAHQLKGSGGGYGYPILTEKARVLEDAAKAQDPEAERLALHQVAGLCQAILRGHSNTVAAKESGQ